MLIKKNKGFVLKTCIMKYNVYVCDSSLKTLQVVNIINWNQDKKIMKA